MLKNGSSVEKIGRSLASAFGFYFNLDAVPNSAPDSAANLMHGQLGQFEPTGTLLTTEQRNIMWAAINTGRTTLLSETCNPPVQLAPRRPEINKSPLSSVS